jgi:nitroreductase
MAGGKHGKVPVLVIPCYEPYFPRVEGDGSIFSAVWNFALALHSRGYGTCVTTLHLTHEKAVCDLLGIPDTYVQAACSPSVDCGPV